VIFKVIHRLQVFSNVHSCATVDKSSTDSVTRSLCNSSTSGLHPRLY